jgi:hypothetical protein
MSEWSRMPAMNDPTLRRTRSVHNVTHFSDKVGCPPFDEEQETITQESRRLNT